MSTVSTDPFLLALLRGELISAQLPEELDLSDITADMEWLWSQSLFHPLEHGSCIILRIPGMLQFMHEVRGTPSGAEPACQPENHADDVTYIGFCHTHLPDEHGRPLIGFSERDYRATLADGDTFSVVHNGQEVFALVRTQDRTRSRGVVSDEEYAEWERLFDDYLERLPPDEAQWRANREICRRLGFAFYRGVAEQQKLRRVLSP